VITGCFVWGHASFVADLLHVLTRVGVEDAHYVLRRTPCCTAACPDAGRAIEHPRQSTVSSVQTVWNRLTGRDDQRRFRRVSGKQRARIGREGRLGVALPVENARSGRQLAAINNVSDAVRVNVEGFVSGKTGCRIDLGCHVRLGVSLRSSMGIYCSAARVTKV
jgi:hypothetical protein